MSLDRSLPVPARWLSMWGLRRPPLTVRCPQAADAQGLECFYLALGRDTLRQRFHCAFNGLSHERIRQLCALGEQEPGRVQTRVAVLRQGRQDTVVGHAGWHLVTPGEAEFALVVADGHQGRGIGLRLMAALVQSAGALGLTSLHASVLPDNQAMLRLMQRMGMVLDDDPDEPGIVRVRRALQAPPPSSPSTSSSSQWHRLATRLGLGPTWLPSGTAQGRLDPEGLDTVCPALGALR